MNAFCHPATAASCSGIGVVATAVRIFSIELIFRFKGDDGLWRLRKISVRASTDGVKSVYSVFWMTGPDRDLYPSGTIHDFNGGCKAFLVSEIHSGGALVRRIYRSGPLGYTPPLRSSAFQFLRFLIRVFSYDISGLVSVLTLFRPPGPRPIFPPICLHSTFVMCY